MEAGSKKSRRETTFIPRRSPVISDELIDRLGVILGVRGIIALRVCTKGERGKMVISSQGGVNSRPIAARCGSVLAPGTDYLVPRASRSAETSRRSRERRVEGGRSSYRYEIVVRSS